MKRLAAIALAALLLWTPARAVSTSAACAILTDASSGRVLYEHNAHERRLIASITKLMTALVAVEAVPDLDTVITVPREATLAEGSSMYLRVGEQLALRDLLYGLLLSSGNDAAVAIAIGCAGDVATFVDWMNQRAVALGMTNSHFVNPNGLNDDAHYSTAYDMSLLAAACMQNEEVAQIVGTKSKTVGTRTLTNHNKLLWQYDGCVGMKTGYTELAGRTLVSCAERDGQMLIAVTLNAPDDWKDHATLLDYGFAHYPRTVLATGGDTVARVKVRGSLVPTVPVSLDETLSWPVAEGEHAEVKFSLPDVLIAPVRRGAVVGEALCYLDGKLIGQTYLLAGADVQGNSYRDKSLLERLRDLLHGKPAEVFAPEGYSIILWSRPG